MRPSAPAEGPKTRENPMLNQSMDPITKPVSTCMSIDSAFLRRIRPAWHNPSAGVCSITNVVAMTMKPVSESSMPSQALSHDSMAGLQGAAVVGTDGSPAAVSCNARDGRARHPAKLF